MDSMNKSPKSNNETKQHIENENSDKSNIDERNANILAGISLACIICSRIIFIISIVTNSIISNEGRLMQAILNLFSGIASIISLAGLVTMIVTRIKYPKSTLGKVAMWTYIVITVLEVLAVIIFTIACIVAGIALLEACKNCPG